MFRQGQEPAQEGSTCNLGILQPYSQILDPDEQVHLGLAVTYLAPPLTLVENGLGHLFLVCVSKAWSLPSSGAYERSYTPEHIRLVW